MDKYISADKLRAMMYNEAFDEDSGMQRWDGGCWIRLYKMFERVIERIEPAHVQEVRRGRWIVKPHKMMGESPCCSECGSFNPIEYRYCPYCGARMNLEDEVEE